MEDSGDFHGRAELVTALLETLARQRLMTVIGPSGSGKSSVVMAGLLPALRRGLLDGSEDWTTVVMIPGANPVDALAEALESGAVEPVDVERLSESGLAKFVDGELLLVVDQFEELYTLADEDQRRKFLDLVVDAVEGEESRTRVVVTLRADFYDRPLDDPRLGRMVRDGLITVLPPSSDELMEMITAPARGVGLRFAAGLPHRIVEDLAGQPGGLPLLQYALTEMVERRDSDVLTLADYERIGGVGAALATRAESLFQDLTDGQQELARQVFLRMVTVDEDTDVTRRRVRRSELESLAHSRSDLDTVLGNLIDQRLLIGDRDPKTRGPTVEIAHEALLREWPRLASWVDDQRDALILGRRFRRSIADWEAGGHHDDYLLTGSRLAPFVGWAESAALIPDELRFYQASRAKDQAERAARTRRRRLLTGVVAGGAVIAGILAAVAMIQANRANAEAEAALAAEALAEEQTALALQREQEALRERDRARASELSASATAALATDPGLAKRLAVASVLIDEPSLETLSVLHRALELDSIIARYVWPEGVEVANSWTDLHPDGTRLVAGGACCVPSPRLEVFDLVANRTLWEFETAEFEIGIDRPQFTPDGTRVVAGLFWWDEEGGQPPDDGLGVRIWDAETGVEEARLDLGDCGAWVLDVSSTHLLAVTLNGEDHRCFAQFVDDHQVALEVVEILTGDRLVLTSSYSDGGVFSGDGRRVAYTDEAERLSVVFDLDSGERVLELDFDSALGPSFFVASDLNHDGSLMLASNRPIEVWDVDEGKRIATFDDHAGAANAIFSPADDGTVFSVGQSAILHHWVAETGDEINSVAAVNGFVLSASNDGVLVTDASASGAVLMDVEIREEVWSIPPGLGGFFPNPLRAVGDRAAFIRFVAQGRIDSVVVDLDKKEWVQVVPGQNGQGLAVSPDGTRFVRQDANAPTEDGEPVPGNWLGPVRVRDIETGDVLVEFKGLCTFDQNVKPHLGQPGCAPPPEGPVPAWISHLEWSPDGRFVAGIGELAGVTIVWDADTGDLVHTVDNCLGSYGEHVFFTPESDQLIVFCKRRLLAFDTATWRELRSSHAEGERGDFGALWFAGFDNDGSHLIGIGSSATVGWSLVRIDPDTLQGDVIGRIVEGQPKSWAMSPDRRRVALGSADGWVKVWDLESGTVVHEINIGNTQANGVAFLNDSHLMVLSQQGDLKVYTLDLDELVALVRQSLTIGFTSFECERYGFGDECPTLEELRGEVPAS
jgi:WD40 repeat protein